MKMSEIDVRGLSCPVPVIRVKKAHDESPGAELTVLVDTETTKDNVIMLAAKLGRSVDCESVPNGFRLLLVPRK
jgi:tRNA 2-thiouridine synthesizing protein A